MEPASIVSELDLQWQNDTNLCENIQRIVKEYKEARKLQPVKIILLGPPASGKTEIAKELSAFYDIHYISVSSLILAELELLVKDKIKNSGEYNAMSQYIEYLISKSRTNIKYTNEQLKIKEEKAARVDEEEAEEEEEDEDEDLEGAAAELQMKLKNLERGLEEGPDGRLPDNTIIERGARFLSFISNITPTAAFTAKIVMYIMKYINILNNFYLISFFNNCTSYEKTATENLKYLIYVAIVMHLLVKKRLTSNACQNQGYLLDGYPKTAEQTKLIFEIGGEGGDEEDGGDEEGGEEEGNEGEETRAKKLMLPDYLVSLDASDEYLCNRVMSFPESKIQGSHYMEELMIRRLDDYRTNNTEDNTLLNVFDEIEIHPYIVDAETDDQEAILSLIKEKIGKPKGYPLSDFELEQIRLLDEENQNRLLEEQARLREEMDKKAKDDKEANMERWIDMLQTLQHEEEHMLTAQSKPLREYIIKFIFPTLTRGLLETARVKPEDPVDFLAEYLFKMNPEGRMFDPSFVNTADELFQTIEDFQDRLGL